MDIVVSEKKRALYFGCLGDVGHFITDQQALHRRHLFTDWIGDGFPWNIGHLDSGLLKNGRRADVYDGKVFWTGGGTPFWLAFVWWDNSVDRRGASNSGFYVLGFDHHRAQEALDYAGSVWPEVIARQRQPLVLQP